MTIDDLDSKICGKLDAMNDKLDGISITVARHDENLSSNNRESREVKERVAKLEKWMWWTLGAGSAAGIGISKLFM